MSSLPSLAILFQVSTSSSTTSNSRSPVFRCPFTSASKNECIIRAGEKPSVSFITVLQIAAAKLHPVAQQPAVYSNSLYCEVLPCWRSNATAAGQPVHAARKIKCSAFHAFRVRIKVLPHAGYICFSSTDLLHCNTIGGGDRFRPAYTGCFQQMSFAGIVCQMIPASL